MICGRYGPYTGWESPWDYDCYGELTPAAIAVIVVGCVVAVILFGLLALWLYRRWKRSKALQTQPDEEKGGENDVGNNEEGEERKEGSESAAPDDTGMEPSAGAAAAVEDASTDDEGEERKASGAAWLTAWCYRGQKGKAQKKQEDKKKDGEGKNRNAKLPSAGAAAAGMHPPEGASEAAAAAVAAAAAPARAVAAVVQARPQVCRQYSLAEVAAATGGWAEATRIGSGSFGDVYKGVNPENPSEIWAVKRAKILTNDFKREVNEMATKNHPNLVRLLGYCFDVNHETDRIEQIVIYEFMANGDLERWIGPNAPAQLSAGQRIDMMIGMAHGLQYLHAFGIVHRDIKPANVLLDSKMQVKIADFGLVRMGEGTSVLATRVMGTPGYVDPAYFKSQKATPMADVHSLGVVMLTVITARKAVYIANSDQHNLKSWVAPLVAAGDVAAFKDPHLHAPDDFVLRFAKLALSCTVMPTASRPTMSRILSDLLDMKSEFLGAVSNRMAEKIDRELEGSSADADFNVELARAEGATPSSGFTGV